MKVSLTQEDMQGTLDDLSTANRRTFEFFPGDSEKRQPVHTVYGGAHLFKSNTAGKISELAIKSFKEFAPNPRTFQKALGFSEELADTVYARVKEKLEREALEDFRIDFEDGFGNRPDQEEDETAVKAANHVYEGMQQGTLPPFIGIRIKTLTEELQGRAFRTLDLFVTTLVRQSGGKLPDNFVVTLPKIVNVAQVSALVNAFELLEQKTELESGALKMEFMIETTQSILSPEGVCPMPNFLQAAKGRCIAAHFGTYDYTASNNITAEFQAMDHPACDFARHMMKNAFSGTGLWLSDGATNVMPVGDSDSVHAAWRLSYQHIRHSLRHAFYQGWDLHPAQLPVRYGALYAFFLESLDAATIRLKNFIEQAAKATLVGDVFDDAATGQGLLNFFLKALNSGAITEKEVLATGLKMDELRTRSFVKIVHGRRKL
ncbi:MAG: phosphoenolpyruvate kinase [Halobacteriovoraceae bacterium]|nr:phosphoenolpyruvate kinase [Halobacteriovoraceae bacterium]MBT5095710.1 phosphoenolpyruvate kinase [Halobacteriovoraceae bacterium]